MGRLKAQLARQDAARTEILTSSGKTSPQPYAVVSLALNLVPGMTRVCNRRIRDPAFFRQSSDEVFLEKEMVEAPNADTGSRQDQTAKMYG